MVETLQSNSRFRQRMLLFEIGRVYLPQPGEELPDEPRRLAIGLTGPIHPASWQTAPDDTAHLGFTHLKGVVETLVKRLNTPDSALSNLPRIRLCTRPARQPLYLHGECIGIMGELHPQLRESFALPDQPVALLELDLDALIAARQPRHFTPIARFPAVLEDIALVMDADVPARAVQDTIEAAGGELLRHVELFDLYQGESIPEGKKSLAYALTFQADDRNLTEDEVRAIYQRIQQRAADGAGCASTAVRDHAESPGALRRTRGADACTDQKRPACLDHGSAVSFRICPGLLARTAKSVHASSARLTTCDCMPLCRPAWGFPSCCLPGLPYCLPARVSSFASSPSMCSSHLFWTPAKPSGPMAYIFLLPSRGPYKIGAGFGPRA